MSDFRAIVIEQQVDGGRITAHTAEVRQLTDAMLMPGDVTIAVEFSDLNYKDGLAIAGRPGVARTSPLIPGIDIVGTVESSEDPRWRPGDRVVLNGSGIGEAAIGTAGFTAMLAVLALERNGVDPQEVSASGSSVLVTGAAGGVGSVAIALLAKLGYPVTASTGRVDEVTDYLTDLGASTIIDRSELDASGKPLQSQRWAGAVDSVGSQTLATVLAQTRYGGAVAACGLAQGPDLPATVLPFILRAVTLVGINSVEAPAAMRETAWRRLATDLDEESLAAMTRFVSLAEAIPAADDILAGRLRGRTVVDVRA